jgi:hypothetical protein
MLLGSIEPGAMRESADNNTGTRELNRIDDDVLVSSTQPLNIDATETLIDSAVNNTSTNAGDTSDDDVVYVCTFERINLVPDETIVISDDDDVPTPNRPIKPTNQTVMVQNQAGGTLTSYKLACPICLQNMVQPTSTVCRHIYCNKCICRIILTTGRCALCRQILTFEDIFPIFL